MDIPKLPLTLLEAGKDYDRSLRRLGLRGDGLVWVWDTLEEEFHLYLIWAGVEKYGPLALAELLLRAYNCSHLPKSVDPFAVHFLSDRHPVAKLLMTLEVGLARTQVRSGFGDAKEHPAIHSQGDWVVRMNKQARNSVEVGRDWKRFRQAVNKLAA